MKRSLVASILGIVACVASARGAGSVWFENYEHKVFAGGVYDYIPVTWGVLHPTGYNTGQPVFNNSIVIGLYAGKGVLTDSSALTLIATTPLFNTLDYGGGWYDMAYSGVGQGFAFIPSDIYTGKEKVTFQVRGSGYLTEGASALWQEVSETAGGAIADYIGGPPDTYSMQNGPLPLVLNYLPEPSVLAFTGLGLAALSCCNFGRRRRCPLY